MLSCGWGSISKQTAKSRLMRFRRPTLLETIILLLQASGSPDVYTYYAECGVQERNNTAASIRVENELAAGRL